MPPLQPPPSAPDLPLHELLALEAVQRLGSVKAAADALHLTASGVSHRIASLERRIGAPLLQRRGRNVALTALAGGYVQAIAPGLAALGQATQALRRQEHRVVRIATAAAIGAAWLLPRLRRFAARHPEARFELLTVATADELPPDRWDLLIHYGHTPRRGAAPGLLFQERLIRVGAPGRSTAAALRLTQLDATAPAGERRGAQPPTPLVFDDALAMLQAAAAGAGTAWTTETAAGPYLAQGRLERIGPEERTGECYTADLSESGRLKPLAASLHAWLLRHAGDEGSKQPPLPKSETGA